MGSLRPVDKFAFPSDTRSTLSTGLSVGRSEMGAFGNAGVAGYFGGGQNYAGTVDKIAFPADTTSTLGTGLSSSRATLAGMSNEGTF
jgi:hypothetical protein